MASLYKLLNRKKIAQTEELLDISLAQFIEYFRRNCCYKSFDEVINHTLYGKFNNIDEEDKYENDNEETREEIKSSYIEIVLEKQDCSTKEEFLQKKWGFWYPEDIGKIAMREVHNSMKTALVISSEQAFNELCDMIENINSILDEYGEILLEMNSRIGRTGNNPMVECANHRFDMPQNIKLKFNKFMEFFFIIYFYMPYFEEDN